VFQFLLDRSLDPDFSRARIARAAARRIARLGDPLVRYRLNGRMLALPLSHDLPWNIRVHPTYSDNLRRLAAFVREREGAVRMIDVGANIGDSWALAQGGASDTFLLVEGSPRYFELLERNTRGVAGVTCVRQLVSDRRGDADVSIVLDEGNARVVPGGDGASRETFETVDGLIASRPEHVFANLLKVDVEGADTRVLRGARELITRARPAILFEHSPSALVAAGEDDRAIFTELAAWGYPQVLLYDHRGLLLGEAATTEAAPLDAWLRFARLQPGSYYDVAALSGGALDAFAREELAYYAALEPRSA
jgi:FkbM family methyltransferase